MRILMLIPQVFYSTRGSPLCAYHRTMELVRRGHEIEILTYGIGGPPPPELKAKVFRAHGPHFSADLSPGPTVKKIWFDFLLFVNLLWRLLRGRYDAIYSHEEGAFLARVAKVIFGLPYIYDMHSSLPLQITDWNFSKRRWVVRLFGWIERVSVRGASAIVAISPAVAAVARRSDPDARVVIIVNYLGSGRADNSEAERIRARYHIASGRKLILYTGTFVALQALDLLIEAIVLVLRDEPEAVFLLVGGTDPEIAALKRQAAQLGVAGAVIFDGNRPQEEMPMYMAAADVLVSPRVQGINPPSKLFPYLDSGKPIVATDTLVHNQILDAQNSVLTLPNAHGLADGIVRALRDAQLRERVTAGAMKFLEAHCSPAARHQAYQQLLDYVAR